MDATAKPQKDQAPVFGATYLASVRPRTGTILAEPLVTAAGAMGEVSRQTPGVHLVRLRPARFLRNDGLRMRTHSSLPTWPPRAQARCSPGALASFGLSGAHNCWAALVRFGPLPCSPVLAFLVGRGKTMARPTRRSAPRSRRPALRANGPSAGRGAISRRCTAARPPGVSLSPPGRGAWGRSLPSPDGQPRRTSLRSPPA